MAEYKFPIKLHCLQGTALGKNLDTKYLPPNSKLLGLAFLIKCCPELILVIRATASTTVLTNYACKSLPASKASLLTPLWIQTLF
jgi:hypothetical protein